ncbi:MAG TPA: terminase TerL endonuclease subunit, partial [Pseudogracilibacillus sp.]|nr:terminase TerL endonuclease subunit [Pseudogracilibacillus sp.]
FGVFDEIHEFKDYKLINVIKNSRGSRMQPLIMYITTAGYQLDGPLVDYYEDANDVLNGIVEDERTFYYMAELDDARDIHNPLHWIKANPNIGVSLNLETMIEDWKKAQTKPEERTDYITKQFNMFVRAGAHPFIEANVLRRNDDHIQIEELLGRHCVGGYDLSDSEDFTSACLEFPLDDGRIFVLSHSWLPEKKVIANNEKIPYREYEKLGYLTIVPEEYIKKEYVEEWFIEMSKLFVIEKITFDRAKAYRLNESLKNHGFETQEVKQTPMSLGPIVDDLREMFIDGKVVFNEDRLLRWYINNVTIKQDRNKNNFPQKQSRYRKIDGFAAFLNAHSEVMKTMIEPEGEGNIEYMSVSDLIGG